MLRRAATRKDICDGRPSHECHLVHDHILLRDLIIMASFKHLGKIYHTSCTFEGGEQVSDTCQWGFGSPPILASDSTVREDGGVCRER